MGKQDQPKTPAAPGKQLLKAGLGIDVSKDKLDVCYVEFWADGHLSTKWSKKLSNDSKGLKLLDERLKTLTSRYPGTPLSVCMEATGVYHERACHFLHDSGYSVSVLLPNQVKAFGKSLNIKSKNDKVDAALIARMAVERAHAPWVKPSKEMSALRGLARERQGIIDEKTSVLNQLHAAEHANSMEKGTRKRFEKRIGLMDKQLEEVEAEMFGMAEADGEIQRKMSLITSVPGMGKLTAVVLLAETNSFADIASRSQLTSYAGYDVVERQSGNTAGQTRISKKGNSRIRKAMYFPAIVAAKKCTEMTQVYERVFERTRIKMKAYTAIQRRLLLLAYTLCKNDKPYEKGHEHQKQEKMAKLQKDESKGNLVLVGQKNVDTPQGGCLPCIVHTGLALRVQI
jgi:transposase